MKRIAGFIILLSCSLFAADSDYASERDRIVRKYAGVKPSAFGMYIPGVKTRIRTDKKIIALTFDACGGTGGRHFDRALISYLSDNGIPATLFVTTSWIRVNESAFDELKMNGNFDLQNHGYNHKPASVTGAAAWKIPGSKDAGECFDEFEMSAREFQKRTGHRPVLYRSGTAYFDDVAVKILAETGQTPMNFSGVTGDADRSLSLAKVEQFIRQNIRPGAVLIMHFNHPEGKTLAALKDMIPEMKKQGYQFVKLTDYRDFLE